MSVENSQSVYRIVIGYDANEKYPTPFEICYFVEDIESGLADIAKAQGSTCVQYAYMELATYIRLKEYRRVQCKSDSR